MHSAIIVSALLALRRLVLTAAVIIGGAQYGMIANAFSQRHGSVDPPSGSAAQALSSRERERALSAGKRAVQQALTMIPTLGKYEVVLIDPELAADPEAVRRLDAFTVREDDGRLRSKIYINAESPIVREAARSNSFYISVLASVIVHEIAHLTGGDEKAARLAERKFFEGLIAQGKVDPSDGRRHLALLDSQPSGTR